ncbi:MAG: acyl-CoA dehydrogenase [Alteromonas sp.]|jgi:citronellyl-CoA dehydrogenase|uniref:Citronellyl-CoA dehydrogenase n=1 Tax=Paraglaciecola chathamensis TaxID=368405 RepID=A0A8H9M2R3_9ALTE|nr:acyl-CoA dehydrogenase family protein [Paraglaciecola oceanifecundans]MAI64989.1 acyl-CoA dehydrogenase [Alteromonas sp.]GGZ83709.1 citronellyl-CoA dehydrogenase [Paraglaciecola oceanifecundans]|tara:strand:+ start:3306 stop:4463 length:1158 start_codon:yes stop_codon:yes gene_type:complete
MIFTQEHDSIRKTVSQFIDKEINPYCNQWEKDGIFPAHDLFKKMGDLGLLGINKPVEFGGLGLDYSYQIVFTEELGRIRSGGVSMAIGVQTDMATPALAKYGSDFLREKYLSKAISGEAVFSIAVSEPHAGSDVAAIKTKAVKDGDDYIINGSKMWITNATQADYLCVLLNTEGDNPHKNKSMVIVPTNLPGVSFSEKLDKLGMRSSDTAQVFFDSVRVPQANLVGEEGMGFIYQMEQFQEERLYSAAANLKCLEFCIEDTIEYVKERHVFGKPILHNQVVYFRLAELQTEISALRALTYDAVESYVNGGDVTMKASMAKLKGGRLAREVTDSCLQYWGGMGFMWDNSVSRAYRDTRLMSIGGGADEVMLSIIAKNMGIFPSRKV